MLDVTMDGWVTESVLAVLHVASLGFPSACHALTLLWTLTSLAAISGLATWQFVALLGLRGASLRLSLTISWLLHEWSHMATAGAFSLANLLGHTPPSLWLQALNPLSPLPPNLEPHVQLEKDTCLHERGKGKAIRLGGWVASLVICFVVGGGGLIWGGIWWEWSLLGCICCLFGATATDLMGEKGVSTNTFYCGNFGLLMQHQAKRMREKALDAMAVLEAMAAVSTERGGQSGGLVTFLKGWDSTVIPVRVRVCPSKRESLSKKLLARFRLSCFLSRSWSFVHYLFSWLPTWQKNTTKPKKAENLENDCAQVFSGHTRFATSSIPSSLETHPHQWTPTQKHRMWRVDPVSGDPSMTFEQMGVFVTHNGDFEFWNLFGRDRTHTEMGLWLHKVLGRKAPAECDSASIGGLLELLRTQGLWFHSLRLAFQQVVVTSYEEVVVEDRRGPCSAPSQKAIEILATLAENTFSKLLPYSQKGELPSKPELQSLKRESQEGIGDFTDCDLSEVIKGEAMAELSDALYEAFRSEAPTVLRKTSSLPEKNLITDLSEESLRQLLRQTVNNFLHNDLFWAVRHFFAYAKGSFGVAATCTLDSERVVLAAYKQPLSVGFAPAHQALLYSSEAHALKVSLIGPQSNRKQSKDASNDHITCRLDLDEADGEVLELLLLPSGKKRNNVVDIQSQDAKCIGLQDGPLTRTDVEGGAIASSRPFVLEMASFVRLRLHNRRLNCATGLEELMSGERLVSLERNRYVTLHPPVPKRDLVGQDIKEIPRVLAEIRADWSSESSFNRRTAQVMFEMLLEKAINRASEEPVEGNNRREIDLLVVGVENSLWVGEQFAADLQNLFPQLRVVPISANKVIGVMGNARGSISTAGFSFCRISTALTRNSLVLSISQSGQTFPTLQATRILAKQCPGRVFVCVGALDSKMSAAVGQKFAAEAPFEARVFCTNAGWRSAEPATVSAVAAHATLTELMLLLARQLRTSSGLPGSPLGLRLSRSDILDLQRMRDAFVERGCVAIVGCTADGAHVASEIYRSLTRQGRQWAMHILETPIAWAMACVYISVTVIFGIPIFTSIRRGLDLGSAGVWAAHVLDAAVYCFLPLLFALLLRVLQGRQLLARIGMRTMVIADIPYVHQLLEIYVTKLFALSYWIASVEVHGANPIDHLVHRFTHRVRRGTLLAIGRPDGRLCSQTKCESWVLMALLQARSIISLGMGAEAITIGHNPHSSAVIKKHLILPSHRPHFLCEKLLGVDDFEPMKRMASRQHALQVTGGNTKFDELDGLVVGSHLCMEGTLQKARRQGLLMMAHGRMEIDAEEMEDPDARSMLLGAMDLDVQKILDSQAPLEELTENRFLSLERLLAFQVMFHSMARQVASIWPLRFDISRSQSGLRIATTAAPVSAADLDREWKEAMEDQTRDVTVHRRGSMSFSKGMEGSNRGGSSLSRRAGKSPGASLHGGIGGSSYRGMSPGSTLHRILREGLSLTQSGSAMDEGSKREGSTHRRRVRSSHDITPGASLRGGMGPFFDARVLKEEVEEKEVYSNAFRNSDAPNVPSRREEAHEAPLEARDDGGKEEHLNVREGNGIPRPESRVWGGDDLRQILHSDIDEPN